MTIWDGQCDDSCGWLAAVVAAWAYGSFGVPIRATRHIPNVHPLVFQSYKTLTMFVLSWLVLTMGVDVVFTPWGLLSGGLWVLGGTGGIYAIRLAGLAVAVGTWASVMICVNFVWGILIFQEPVANVSATACSFLLLGLGLVGMSRYSAPQTSDPASRIDADPVLPTTEDGVMAPSVPLTYGSDTANEAIERNSRGSPLLAGEHPSVETEQLNTPFSIMDDSQQQELEDDTASETVELFGSITLSRRNAGLLGAVLNGLMTGSSLIPLHYAKEQGYGGARYMISFATGALIFNALVWILYFGYQFVRNVVAQGSIEGTPVDTSFRRLFHTTAKSMPPWQVRQLWLSGLAAGTLLAIAMFGSILAVTYLGQGVGNSLVQTKILISGLYGIFWFKEIQGWETISKWFASATITVLGILWLSHERLAAVDDGGGSHRLLFESSLM